MSDNLIIDNNSQNSGDGIVPNATACLVLGILSLVGCLFYGIPGVVMGIVAIVLHGKDKKLHATNPSYYAKSFQTSKAGFVCGLIGIILGAVFAIVAIFMLFFLASTITSNGDLFRNFPR